MCDEHEKYQLFVYDIENGLFLKEDNIHINDFAKLSGTLYFNASGQVFTIDTEAFLDNWSVTMPFTELDISAKKYYSLYFRVEIFENSYLKVETSHNNKPFKQVLITHNKTNFSIPLKLSRSDSFKIRLSGSGRTHIKNLTYKYRLGSEHI